MVQIRIIPETKEIEIKIPFFYLYEIIDNDAWLEVMLQKCKELIIEEFENEGLNEEKHKKNASPNPNNEVSKINRPP